MSYFKEEQLKTNKTLSDKDRVFLEFSKIHTTEDRFEVNDEIIKAIISVYGEINKSNVYLIQEIYEKLYGEPNVPHNIIYEEKSTFIEPKCSTNPKIKI